MAPNRFNLPFLRQLGQNPLRALEKATAPDSPLSRIEAGPFRCFLVTDPLVGAKVLNGSADRYKRTPDLAFWFPPAGEGVASSPHEKWLKQRRLLAPFFKASADTALRERSLSEADRLLERVDEVGGEGQEFDAQALIMETTLRTAVQHLILAPFPGDAGKLSGAIQTAMHYAAPARAIAYRLLARVSKGLALKALHPRPKREALALLDGFVDELIAIGSRRPEECAPMFRALLAADSAGQLEDGELRDQIATFLVAAVDSVGSAITWTLWHLARDPAAAALAASSATGAQACVLESMRRVPPLWIFWREVRKGHELAGETLREQDLVVFVPHVFHTRPELWPDPLLFRPQRFLDGNTITNDSGFAYMPFGHGAHACLGRRMAITEATTVVHKVASEMSFELAARTADRGPAPVVVRVAVLVEGGLWLRQLGSSSASPAQAPPPAD